MGSSKTRHEAFVSNLRGGDLSEVFAVSAATALLFVFSAAVKSLLPKFSRPMDLCLPLLLDVIIAVIPAVLLVTALSSQVFLFLLLLLLLLLLFPLFLPRALSPRSVFDVRGHSAAVSCFRGLVLFSSSVCILAVDFPIFPRRFAKAETFGSGVMDVGVGSFAVVMGMVSREARGLPPQLGRTLRVTVAPLLVLGTLRTLSVKASGYQEHVSEYGVHWNFFLTLACSELIVTMVTLCTRQRLSPLFLAILFTCLHAAFLRFGGEQWVLEAPRSDFVSANKEGLASLPAYAAMELWGVWLGRRIDCNLRSHDKNPQKLCALLLSVALLSTALTAALSPISRRLGNSAYIAWAVSNSAMTLFIFLAAQVFLFKEGVTSSSQASRFGDNDILGALNRFGMFHFLIANLLTGLVNFAIDTLTVSNGVALCVLIIYQMLLLGAVRARSALL